MQDFIAHSKAVFLEQISDILHACNIKGAKRHNEGSDAFQSGGQIGKSLLLFSIQAFGYAVIKGGKNPVDN